LEIRPSVEKALRIIRDAQLQRRLDETLSKIAENPRRMGVEKMAGFKYRYRFRVGHYRIIYEIHAAALLVLLLAVGDRKEIYRCAKRLFATASSVQFWACRPGKQRQSSARKRF
jgi:mRNA interferase RelE/StbE